jgi:5-(carboxyamino)imidazole ribonucleotide synthase
MSVAILGAGQLARMLALAAHRLGVRCVAMDEHPDAVAGHVCALHVDRFDAPTNLDAFLSGCAVCTYEFENVPAALAERVAQRVALRPGAEALARSQDRVVEKTLFNRLGVRTARFAPVDTLDDLRQAAADLGLPAILKTRRLGYDGKGQRVVRAISELDDAFAQLAGGAGAGKANVGNAGLILEAFVPFARELSIISARGLDGSVVFYPLVENHHHEGILRLSIAPASGVDAALQRHAQELATRVLVELGYVGVLAIELFDLGPSLAPPERLVANEMAPRVHNSGHWTMDASECDQFENHIRAIVGLPLGSTRVHQHAAMVNIVGQMPPLAELAAIDGARVHLYAKSARAGRKLGHVNVVAGSEAELRRRVLGVASVLGIEGGQGATAARWARG